MEKMSGYFCNSGREVTGNLISCFQSKVYTNFRVKPYPIILLFPCVFD